jgi:hypothetical protein
MNTQLDICSLPSQGMKSGGVDKRFIFIFCNILLNVSGCAHGTHKPKIYYREKYLERFGTSKINFIICFRVAALQFLWSVDTNRATSLNEKKITKI